MGGRLPDVRRRVATTGRPKPGPPPVHHARIRTTSTSSSPTRCTSAAAPTTSCSTAGSSARAAIRIHEPELQQRIFDLLGIGAEEAQRRSGSSSTPFRYGAPPHGGFAFGIDRLAALLAGEENIREVIAFPKTQSGSDPMTHSPTPVDPTQLAELGLRALPPPT